MAKKKRKVTLSPVNASDIEWLVLADWTHVTNQWEKRMPEQSRSNLLLKACYAVIAVGTLNFLMFVAGATYLGGDAVNGKIENGRYYLFGVRTDTGHKVYTEVSKPVFTYSRWHVYSIFATWPLVMAAAVVLNRRRKRRNGG